MIQHNAKNKFMFFEIAEDLNCFKLLRFQASQNLKGNHILHEELSMKKLCVCNMGVAFAHVSAKIKPFDNFLKQFMELCNKRLV